MVRSDLTGQETALIAALSGKPAKPTLTPPYPFERGLRGRPTLVSNTETYSHIGSVARGTYDGTRLVTVGGAVSEPGLVEIAPENTIGGVLQSVGEFTEKVQAVLLGGYGGTWARLSDVLTVPLDERILRERHLTLGAGIVFLLGESACPVAEVARVATWMTAESAGQCGPCVHGLKAIADALGELTTQSDHFRTRVQILRWSEMVKRRGACAHPDGVARFVQTALAVFADEFDDHIRHGACGRCATSDALPTPPRSRAPTRPHATRESSALRQESRGASW